MFNVVEDLSVSPHTYLCFEPRKDADWGTQLAKIYIELRGESPIPLNPLIFDGVQILDVSTLRRRIQQATLPSRRDTIFDVVRSDFGEVLSYLILETFFLTKFGYKQVRDREIIDLPGRGIDAIGVEKGEDSLKPTLILVETKVSDENMSPPQVVDKATTSLRAQHQAHLQNHEETCRKIWDIARRSLGQEVRDLFFAAAIYFQDKRWDKIDLVCCCFLVRSRQMYQPSDFGTFFSSPNDYLPANIRFLVMRCPECIDDTVNIWYNKATQFVGQ